MLDVPDQVLNAFLDCCHEAASRGLVRCSSGNLSCRLDDERFLVTATGSWMERLSREEVSVCRIADGALLDGPRASGEIGFHAGILSTRPEVNVVMHFQSPFATTLACRGGDDIDFFVIPEIPFYIGQVARVPYLLPGSRELADAVVAAMREHDLALMVNHGAVTVASDTARAIQNAELFELACHVIVHNENRGSRYLQPTSSVFWSFEVKGEVCRRQARHPAGRHPASQDAAPS